MIKAVTTRDKLINAARTLFWTRGYSNVSVRDITGAAGVDAALVSRYFGGKQGLFEATLAEIPPWEALAANPEDLLAKAAESFAHPFDPEADAANVFTMLIANVIDPEMGGTIRETVQQQLADPLAEKIGGAHAQDRAAALLAVLFGMALMRKNFQTKALAQKSPDALRTQIMRLGLAALET
ncbi:TetR family transcriptional regulator [Roseibium sp. HPY-6]|uniref:TetR/AcrR family transcriptional regulator n=1 Tax=Roseibium sp. HPY-6 TaxID=3229852 RepID=UPI00338DC8D5